MAHDHVCRDCGVLLDPCMPLNGRVSCEKWDEWFGRSGRPHPIDVHRGFARSLAGYSTERLLEMLRWAQKRHNPASFVWSSRCWVEGYGYEADGLFIPVADIKTELAGREHVPNKNERRRHRQDAARCARSQRKARHR